MTKDDLTYAFLAHRVAMRRAARIRRERDALTEPAWVRRTIEREARPKRRRAHE